MKVIAIYDNGGTTADRYTVYFDEIEVQNKHGEFNLCLAMSEHPCHPQGFCQHSSGTLGEHNGKSIGFNQLPIECQNQVNRELE